MTTNEQDIKERIQGREFATEMIELVNGGSENFKRAFAIQARQYADSILGTPPTELRVMSTEEAMKFEVKEIKFGQHRGTEYRHVPLFYLHWIADSALDLLAYLRSDIGKNREKELS